MSNDRGRYVELKRGILCIDCHRKIMEKLEQLKRGRYTVGRQPIPQPADAKTPFSATWDWRPVEQRPPKTRPEMKEASQSVS